MVQSSISEKGYQVFDEDRPSHMGQKQKVETGEKALVHAAKMGDLEAFNRLVIAYQNTIFTQAYYLLGDRMAAEDAVQEAFISAYRSFRSYRGGSLQSWLIRIVTNECLDKLRDRKRHPEIGFEARDRWDSEIESPPWLIDPGETPEECLIHAENERDLLRCLKRLTTEYRTALVLVDVFDMCYRDAAEAMGCPIGTFKSRLARARLQMQGFLQDTHMGTRQ